MCAHSEREATLVSSYYLHSNLKREKGDRACGIVCIDSTFLRQTEGTKLRRASLEAGTISSLKFWAFCLFHLKVLFGVISYGEIQHRLSFPGWRIRQRTVYNERKEKVLVLSTTE